MTVSVLVLGVIFLLALMIGGPIIVYVLWPTRKPSETLLQYEESIKVRAHMPASGEVHTPDDEDGTR